MCLKVHFRHIASRQIARHPLTSLTPSITTIVMNVKVDLPPINNLIGNNKQTLLSALIILYFYL